MTLVYDEGMKSTGRNTSNANKHYLTHFGNQLYLEFVAKNSKRAGSQGVGNCCS